MSQDDPNQRPAQDLLRVSWSLGRLYAEVGVEDFESGKTAWTGYLDREERAAVAARLREVAGQLEEGRAA